MINITEVLETNKMIEQENLDVRTITMGISLLSCADSSLEQTCQNIYTRITTLARDLVETGESISREFAIPIVNKRISVTPISLSARRAVISRLTMSPSPRPSTALPRMSGSISSVDTLPLSPRA